MRVITEKRLLEIKDEWHDKYGLRESMAIDHLINTEMQEIDTLTVSKLRPMNTAPRDGTLFQALTKADYKLGITQLSEFWFGLDKFNRDESQETLMLDECDFIGWHQSVMYKPE